MTITLRYFAAIRETLGREQEAIIVPDGATIADLREIMLARYPAVRGILERCVTARNRAFAPVTTPLADGDEVVFIPPMAGGC